ncbi:hypothetical protein StoSoilB13_14640 [Arthrobacter sp. StoSoilB13]|nr:hypothetical protein StoSoilB13_14640 [Arthrobacter sp. StoSoilB13]
MVKVVQITVRRVGRLRSGVIGKTCVWGTLFSYLGAEFAGLQIASTTNRMEGGTNAQLRLLLRAHRGMSEEHRKGWGRTHMTHPGFTHVLSYNPTFCPITLRPGKTKDPDQ